ncbi:Uma2 family endonuclease [Streptomyces sp. 1114.5]|uniref:Uma2 family endonuclease n=1 Tax=unclassified Streptomyces TaxID=2593676 RepID=UPI000BD3C932|nr:MULTISPECIES: Uma2 family endonuclease [unclassified Streptomyces]RKT17430.1 Uma2 family endonuclease [Streptomyces sp. 1114.5]SOB83638.1 Endonuclease, Uma2 family (restriction endonuclease fold) [Streptomyces sp. 1331.2]
MVAMPAVEHPLGEDGLLQTFLELDTPLGSKAEFIEGEIVVTPPPDGHHEGAVSKLAKQFFRNAAIDLDIAGVKGLITPKGRFIPDGTVVPADHFDHLDSWAPAGGVLLVFEVTSINPHKDREPKRKGYAAAGIPCYLLIDRSDGMVTLFTEPDGEDYITQTKVEFGKTIDLPAPFSFTLDTAPLR